MPTASEAMCCLVCAKSDSTLASDCSSSEDAEQTVLYSSARAPYHDGDQRCLSAASISGSSGIQQHLAAAAFAAVAIAVAAVTSQLLENATLKIKTVLVPAVIASTDRESSNAHWECQQREQVGWSWPCHHD